VTLIVALECRDGLVLASESQSTLMTQGQLTKAVATKLSILAGIMWAGSGPIGVIQRAEYELEKQSGNISSEFRKGGEPGAKELHKYVNAVQRQAALEAMPSAGQAFDTAFLFAGYSRDGPFILECDQKGGRQWQHPFHFAAIGSGDIFAVHAWRSVAHYDIANLSLAQAEALGYRTIQDAVATAAFGLGGQVQMCIATKADGPRHMDKTEVDAIDDAVKLWKQREVEALGALAPTPAEAGEPPNLPQEG
jgi:20S proteasome alpha/beta subunit